MRKVKAIIALDEYNGMSKDGKIPWKVKEDFAYFRKYTLGKTCVMGRNTYEDMLTYCKNKDDPLPGRKIIVVTSKSLQNVRCIKNLHELESLFLDEELVLCGGKRIYEEGRNIFFVEEFSVTEIQGNYECDVFFNPHTYEMAFATQFKLCDHLPHVVSIYYHL